MSGPGNDGPHTVGWYRVPSKEVMDEDEKMAIYRRLGTPLVGDQSDEANAIRRRKEPKPQPVVEEPPEEIPF